MKKNIRLFFRVYLQGALYILAGISHFLSPGLYVEMIPSFFPNPELLNHLAGALEILLGLGLIIPGTRKIASISLVILLLIFMSVHIDMLNTGWVMNDGTQAPALALWLRLILIHPLLLYWAYLAGKGSAE